MTRPSLRIAWSEHLILAISTLFLFRALGRLQPFAPTVPLNRSNAPLRHRIPPTPHSPTAQRRQESNSTTARRHLVTPHVLPQAKGRIPSLNVPILPPLRRFLLRYLPPDAATDTE
ncbi:hypothetical protein CH63R_01943 [Colletotrichum higginsianum IMI 349063]|uniref:Uncharacterized protein n=1 Tax=Colletotrichum higginsianum (strain IMI 349063) TaxID=759273 RepID=A0A1B7YME7_COLHI|nr:hypothetical protein CH63R_01943 [Colletotrichum higginsianum IMI 349063]OBR13217.1 hypothetical protein CH63R_01943 [Colletotrichum higginsianum IMI 349063]